MMLLNEDVPWFTVVAFAFVFLYIVSKIMQAGQKTETKEPMDSKLVANDATKIAEETLVGFGWSKKQAKEAVTTAVIENPGGDYNVLVNVAMRK